MTFEHIESLLKIHGPKALLILKLTSGSEMVMRGSVFIYSQQDLFRERVRFSTPWTECLIDLKDIESGNHDGKRIRIVLRTDSIVTFPPQ